MRHADCFEWKGDSHGVWGAGGMIDSVCSYCQHTFDAESVDACGFAVCSACQKESFCGKSEYLSESDAQLLTTLLERGILTLAQCRSFMTQFRERFDQSPRPTLSGLLDELHLTPRADLLKALEDVKGLRHIEIPGYEMQSRLGVGGMGTVYRARHLSSQKQVAIKILSSKYARRSDLLERFRREARVAMTLDSPHIVKGYEVGEYQGQNYFVMEFILGKSTDRVLKKRGRFGEYRSLDIVRQVAEALDHAATKGIVHRDIKPSNIIITKEGVAKLADYGLVKMESTESLAALTLEGQVMGTPNYISPEQASGMRDVDIRSDIYSLGASLFHFLTGKAPFSGEDSVTIIRQHRDAPVPDPRDLVPTVSEHAALIVKKMLAKSSAERYQTPREVVDAIVLVLSGEAAKNGLREDLAKDAEEDAAQPLGDYIFSDRSSIISQTPFESAVSKNGYGFLAMLGVLCMGLCVLGGWVIQRGSAPSLDTPDVAEYDDGEPLFKLHASAEDATDVEGWEALDVRPGSSAAIEAGEAICRDISSFSEDDQKAVECLVQALGQSADEQHESFVALQARYPHTRAGAYVAQKLKALQQKEEERLRAERALIEQEAASLKNKKRAEAEAAAQKAYAALRLYHDTGLHDIYREKVTAFLREHAGTATAEKAKKDLRDMELSVAAEANRKRLAAEMEHAKLEATEIQQKFAHAILRNDTTLVEERIQAFLDDKSNASMHKAIQSLRHDIKMLQFFPTSLRGGLIQHKSEELTLSFEGERPVRVVITDVREDDVYLMLDGRLARRRNMNNIALDQRIALAREGFVGSVDERETMIGIYLLTRGKVRQARDIFDAFKTTDPFRTYHVEMLRNIAQLRSIYFTEE